MSDVPISDEELADALKQWTVPADTVMAMAARIRADAEKMRAARAMLEKAGWPCEWLARGIEELAAERDRLAAENAAARAELAPRCADETLLGAIRNLKQAHISERDNAAQLEAENARLRDVHKQMANAAEMLWVVLANVSGGDWTLQSKEWQKVARRWADNYHAQPKEPA